MSANPAKNWAATYYPSPEEIETGIRTILFKEDMMDYLVVGKETCPDTGRFHWQIFFMLKTRLRFATLKNRLELNRLHLEQTRGSPKQNRDYCIKDGDFEEFGQFDEVQMGKRNDLLATVSALDESRLEDLMTHEVHGPIIARHMNYFRSVDNLLTTRRAVAALQRTYSGAVLRAWQTYYLSIVTGEPDRRTVYWVWDKVGGTGKSWFADYLVATQDAIVFSNGKITDIAHAYKRERIVVFDLTRTQAEKLDAVYMAIESLKNGRLFSPKYDSHTKIFATPHVIVFANFEPDKSKLSEDRWKIQEL